VVNGTSQIEVFEAENIRDWRRHDIVDEENKKIGTLEGISVDTRKDEPMFASLLERGALTGRKLTFVPLAGAVVGPGWVKVRFSKKVERDRCRQRPPSRETMKL
jgi:hypothetical protein